MSMSKNSLKALDAPTQKQNDVSPVSNLQNSINLAINLQADNLRLILEGNEPDKPIDAKVWDNILKMVEIMPKLELFEKISKGETLKEAEASQKAEEKIAEGEVSENAFEARSKVIKAKINGKTHIDAKNN
jgi:hypothetical protein